MKKNGPLKASGLSFQDGNVVFELLYIQPDEDEDDGSVEDFRCARELFRAPLKCFIFFIAIHRDFLSSSLVLKLLVNECNQSCRDSFCC